MEGFEVLTKKFEALKGDALAKAERKALRAVGDVIETEMRWRVPIATETTGTALTPGEVQADIRPRVYLANPGKNVDDLSRVKVGPSKKTAHVVSLLVRGHKKRGSKRGQGKDWVPANQFVQATADATATRATDTYVDVMTTEIKKVMDE